VGEDFRPAREWQRSYRRVRARGLLSDPLGQGIVAASSAVLMAGAGVWFLLIGWITIGGWLLGIAAIEGIVYLALAIQAFKRDKSVQFWLERRQLRIDLEREEAFRRVLLRAHHHLQDFQESPPDAFKAQAALAEVAELAFRVFAPAHDDLALLVLEETGARCRILHSELSHGTRWHALRIDKECMIQGDLSKRLDELAGDAYVELHLVGNNPWPISFVVLHDQQFREPEQKMLRCMVPILESMVTRSPAEKISLSQPHLRAVEPR
jgi:hypothetical protein